MEVRTRLSLPRSYAPGPASSGADPQTILRIAIAQGVMVMATYNRRRVRLAPHALYARHGEPFLDAVTVEQDGWPPNSRRLGAFKLDGLSGITATTTHFRPEAGFDARGERYRDTLIAAIRLG